MEKVEIYTKPYCPYCIQAKALLDSKGVDYKEFDVSFDQSALEEMLQRSRRRTVPQIFINGDHVGGSDDLLNLDRSGDLNRILLKEAA